MACVRPRLQRLPRWRREDLITVCSRCALPTPATSTSARTVVIICSRSIVTRHAESTRLGCDADGLLEQTRARLRRLRGRVGLQPRFCGRYVRGSAKVMIPGPVMATRTTKSRDFLSGPAHTEGLRPLSVLQPGG